MGKEQLELVEAEVRGIHGRGATIMMLQIDAEIRSKKLYKPGRPLIEYNGRGGTDFSPFLFELMKAREKPAFAVFYTDGYGCIKAYLDHIKKLIGDKPYKKLTQEGGRTSTPDGIELLWLLCEGTTEPDHFRKTVAPFGRIAVLPKAKLVKVNA